MAALHVSHTREAQLEAPDTAWTGRMDVLTETVTLLETASVQLRRIEPPTHMREYQTLLSQGLAGMTGAYRISLQALREHDHSRFTEGARMHADADAKIREAVAVMDE
jgi:hypothetical protein